MCKKYNKLSAFEYFGTKQTNIRWGWSAISDDGRVVAVTVWKDRSESSGNEKYYYDGFKENKIKPWISRNGNNARKKHLKHAIENCDGLVRVVAIEAENIEKKTRKIKRKEVYPLKNQWFKITKFDEETGQFRLEYHRKHES